MKLYYPITVDLYKIYPLPKVDAQQNNIGRGVIITLTAAGTVIDPSDENVTLNAKKPDGTVSYIPCIVSDRKIKADFTNQILALSGDVCVELLLISGSEQISTPIFVISVHATNIDEKAIESRNEFSALQEAVSNMNTSLKEVDDLKKNGLKGDPGKSATIKVGTVTASDPGSTPTVNNSGTENDAILNFVLPRGEQGPQGIGAEVVADAFDSEKTYAVGDYCIYNNVLYRFTSAKSAGAWDSSAVTATLVETELKSLNSKNHIDFSGTVMSADIWSNDSMAIISIKTATKRFQIGVNSAGEVYGNVTAI